MAYIPDYPQAPFDAVMPAAAQGVVLWIAANRAWRLLLDRHLAITENQVSSSPILFLVRRLRHHSAGDAGHAHGPRDSPGDRPDQPVQDRTTARFLAYRFDLLVLFSAASTCSCTRRIRNGGFTREFVWKSYFFTCVLAYLIEIVPVYIGLWVYYEPQALWA